MGNDKDDAALDALFKASAEHPPRMSDTLLARLAADAEAATPKPAPPPPARRTPLFHGLKGLFAASGLSGAAVLGVWIGFIMPDILTTVSPLTEETAGLTAFLPGADLSALSE